MHDDLQQYLTRLENQIDSNPFYPFALVVRNATEQMNKALDQDPPSATRFLRAVDKAKEELHRLSEE